MADVFDRYHKANEIVEGLSAEETKTRLRSSVQQLLHIEQARKYAMDAFGRYLQEMNDWENSILIFIETEAKKGVEADGTIKN